MKSWLSILLLTLATVSRAGETIRQPVVAGRFYPGNPGELKNAISQFLDEVQEPLIHGRIQAIWVPHAGYEFSGWVAANAYNQVRGIAVDAVVVLGVSHYVAFSGVSAGDWHYYRTPLGDAKVDTQLVRAFKAATSRIRTVEQAHMHEHSVEVQIPFIQTVLPGVPIVPLLVSDVSYEEAREIARAVVNAVGDKRVLFVASSDMSHFPDYRNAYAVDGEMLKAVQEFDVKKIQKLNDSVPGRGIPGLQCGLCGAPVLITTMMISQELGAGEVRVLPYANSGDVTGERDRVVGYGAAVFYSKTSEESQQGAAMLEEISFIPDEKNKLFSVARQSIESALKGAAWIPDPSSAPNLRVKRGVFVTLMNGGRLRGCIGHFEADTPLEEIVARMAAAAAVEDYRFYADPVTLAELKSLDIKISILSERRKIQSPEEIQVGKHGIWVRQGFRGGTYLPEVATEMGWNRIEFLEHCCVEKAGLPRDAWKKGAEVFIYSSQILSEK